MTRLTYVLLAGLLLTCASPALAQESTAEQAGNQGPMTLERVHSGFVLAPEIKVTDIDDTAGLLAGATAGVAIDDSLIIGGAGYWLANGEGDRKLGYGGLVVQWRGAPNSSIGFGVGGLVGLGTATLRSEFDVRRLAGRNSVALFRPRFSQNIVVAEPEASLSLKISDRLRLDWSLSYRFVGADVRGTDDRLEGVSGGVAVRIGGW